MVSLSQTAGDSGGKDMRLSIRSLVSIAVLAIGSLSITMPASAGTGAASFAPGTPMHFARAFPTATELLNGNVLRAAGYDGGQFFSDAEIYNWHSGTWTTVAPMHVARAAAMAVRLSGGRVMVIGGFGPGFSVLDSVEIYDPRADSWSVTGSLNQRRAEDFLAAVLPDGRVVLRRDIAGRLRWRGSIPVPSDHRGLCRFGIRGGLLLGSTVRTFERASPS